MKKIIFMIVAMFMAISMNAQVATENAKLLDNTYVTVGGSVSTPLALDAVFPLNPAATIAVGKWFTPVWGAEVEGTAWFGSHSFGGSQARFDGFEHNAIRGHFVGVNGLVNWTNLILGYKGTPRTFEISTVTGTGWVHTYTPNASDKAHNYLGVKTGLDLAFNLGKTKAHTISIRPAVLWNVNSPGTMPLQFDKRNAQLNLGVAYTYHFKTSNGTRHFKTYDVGALLEENARLQAELEKKPTEVIREVVKTVEVAPTAAVAEKATGLAVVVFFAQNSSVLSDDAKATLDGIGENSIVNIKGYASPEGTEKYNKALSERRAAAVQDYLTKRGVRVSSAEGLGVVGDASNRVVVVTYE